MQSLNPLWRTFIFIVAASFVTAAAIIYVEWRNIKSEASKELLYANNIMTSSIQSVFHKNEALLKILGERLVELGALESPDSLSWNLVDNLLKDNPELAGIGLANPDGQLVLTSFNIDRKKLPNLLETPETADSFKQALNSKSMVVGRTYYMKALEQWLIPLRYRITNAQGKVTAVMTTGLKLDSAQILWSSMHLPDHMRAVIVRKDLYRQYVSERLTDGIAGMYTEPVSNNKYDQFEKSLLTQTGMNFPRLHASGKTISLFALFGDKHTPILTSINYDPTYQHYTLIFIPLSALYGKLLTPVSLLLILLFCFNAALYWIFNVNVRLQLNSKRHLKFQATHDQLTELPNRRYLLDEFNTWRDNHAGRFSVLFIDLDNFKSINDFHGHSMGDKMLREVALRINHCFKNSFNNSLNIRQSGDEFIILNAEINREAVLSLCDNFLNEIKQPIVIGELEFSISASIGIVFAPKDGTDVDALLRKADMAMYEAKRKQSGVYIFSQWLGEQQKRKTMIEAELIHALERNEFFLVYQPQVDAISHTLIGVETLIRWNNQHLGMVSPEEFIFIAESTGLIIDIGEYVLETALKDMSEICQANKSADNIRLSINVSVRQLLSNNFLEQLTQVKNKSEYNAINLIIEVTESLFIEDVDKAKFILEKIQQAGMKVSLDDFGTGYSSLSVLNQLPINELKIDKSFVRDIMADEQDKQLIRSIINLGKSLEIPVLAEGVEDKEQAEFLTEYGCNLFQGYYFSRPLSKDKLIEYILKCEQVHELAY